jgi:hypothetical protein
MHVLGLPWAAFAGRIKAVEQAPGDGFLAATDADLAVGVVGVPLNALDAHLEHVGDLAVGQALVMPARTFI